MRWPLAILEPFIMEIVNIQRLEAQQLADILDALARMRFDLAAVLSKLEGHVEAALYEQRLHEAQVDPPRSRRDLSSGSEHMFISAIPRRYLGDISAISRRYLAGR